MSPDPKSRKEYAVRTRLRRAALTLFTTKGYGATSVREIVAAAQVTKPVLYYYFLNKEGLYLDLISSTIRSFETVLADARNRKGSARSRITRFCRSILAGTLRNEEIVRFIYAVKFGAPPDAPRVDVTAPFEQMLQILREIIAGGVATGELKPGATDAMVWLIAGTVTIIVEKQLCAAPDRISGTALQECLNLVFAGMETLPGSAISPDNDLPAENGLETVH